MYIFGRIKSPMGGKDIAITLNGNLLTVAGRNDIALANEKVDVNVVDDAGLVECDGVCGTVTDTSVVPPKSYAKVAVECEFTMLRATVNVALPGGGRLLDGLWIAPPQWADAKPSDPQPRI